LGHRWDRWVSRITPESFSNFFVYIWQKHPSTAAHVPGAQGEMRMDAINISMSKNKPDELDEFVYIQPNGITTRNT
jgi:hypothetical protein